MVGYKELRISHTSWSVFTDAIHRLGYLSRHADLQLSVSFCVGPAWEGACRLKHSFQSLDPALPPSQPSLILSFLNRCFGLI